MRRLRVSFIALLGAAMPLSMVAVPAAAASLPDVVIATQSARTSHTATLSWAAPSDGGAAISDYVVQYRRLGVLTWSTFDDGVSPEPGVVVTGLNAATHYQFRVGAKNAVGTNFAGLSMIAVGSKHTCALTTAGRVWCWGAGDVGQLGLATATSALMPQPIVFAGNLTVLQIAAGDNTTCALLAGATAADNTVMCWGYAAHGEVGAGIAARTAGVALAPQAVKVGALNLTDVSQIAMNGGNACALQSGHSVYCWGPNTYGQAASASELPSAVKVSGLFAFGIEAGPRTMCATLLDNSRRCWGSNLNGLLGASTAVGTVVTSHKLFDAVATPVEISQGENHSCAVTSAKSVVCWGDNSYRQLGDNSVTPSSTPVAVSALSNVAHVLAGRDHTCAVTEIGDVYCWGRNQQGQLAIGSFDNVGIPTKVNGLPTISGIYGALDRTCAVSTDGEVLCWGAAVDGRSSVPLSVSGLPGILDGSTADAATLPNAMTATATDLKGGNVKLDWDVPADGGAAISDYAIRYREAGTSVWTTAPHAVTTGTTIAIGGLAVNKNYELQIAAKNAVGEGWGTPLSMTAGLDYSCLVASDRTVWCWGNNTYGQLGAAPGAAVVQPTRVFGLGNVTQVAAGVTTTCAVLTDHTVWCWGSGDAGQLGDGSWSARWYPAAVQGINNAVAVSVGQSSACAVLSSGAIKCWGSNDFGQLGRVGLASAVPVDVTGISTATSVQVGEISACALLTSHQVSCWGDNDFGQLGDGSNAGRATAQTIVGLSDVQSIAGSDLSFCALTNIDIKCWGAGTAGQLGDGRIVDSNAPVTAQSTTGALQLSGGTAHFCARFSTGTKCWGSNAMQQTIGGATVPTALASLATAATLWSGYNHNFAQLADGTWRSWGSNGHGESARAGGESIGVGTVSFSPVYAQVATTPVHTAPAAVNPTTSNATLSSVDVAWSSTSSDGYETVTNYYLRYRVAGTDTWSDPTDLGLGFASTVTGLSAATRYEFSVGVKNALGTTWSTATATATTLTPPPVKPGQVGLIISLNPASKSLKFTWSAAAANGSEVRYEYRLWMAGKPKPAKFTAVPKVGNKVVTTLTVKKLIKGKKYSIEVRAVSIGGVGPGRTKSGVLVRV